jgi:hypothetical protein
MVVFHLLLQSSNLLRVSKPAADRFPTLLIGIEGMRTDEHRDIEEFALALKELTGDRSPAHLLKGGDMAEDFLALFTESGELRHTTSLIVASIQQNK